MIIIIIIIIIILIQFIFDVIAKDKKASIPGLPSGIPGVSIPAPAGNASTIRE